jgi:signal transduction histidine kinase/CheY-like chemotaxis protein
MADRLAWLSRLAGLVVAAMGLIAFAGWAVHREELRTLFVTPPVTVKTNAALAMLGAGVALFLLGEVDRARRRTMTARGLALFVLAVGAATVSEHVVGWNLGIDEVLFREPPGALATSSPNRMGPPASISFMLLGLALLLLDADSDRAQAVRHQAAIVVLLIAMLGIVGYATGASPLYSFARVTGIALITALALSLLAAGILAARPDHGLVYLLCQPDEAGALARRLIVPAFLFPLATAMVLTAGVRARFFDDRFATAIMVVTVIVCLTGVIWATAADLSRALRARDAAAAVRARREDALRAANRRQTEFLAVLSHELRNPLAPMRYALEMIPDTEAGPSSPKEVVQRHFGHLVRLVDDLLEVSRIATGKVRLRRRHVELGRIFTQAVEAAAPGMKSGRHQLMVTPPAETVWLDADPDRIAQVVTNLLNNAARYTPAEGRIELSAEVSDVEVLIRVKDDGMGLNEADLPRVFEMFSQIGGPGTGGLGIGLALVKRITEMHGGRVEAHSDGPGTGAEFRVWLPRAEAPQEEEASASPEAPAMPSRKVVVADDNEDSAEMMRTLLEMDGHSVQVAANGTVALDLITSFMPEVAVLDIGMPGMDGYEVARRVRAEGKEIYLIAVTGWGQESDRKRAEAAGFDAHITKPASPDDLRRLVARR